MIPLGARVTARLDDGRRVTGRVTATWDGGCMVQPDSRCACPDCRPPLPVCIRERQVILR